MAQELSHVLRICCATFVGRLIRNVFNSDNMVGDRMAVAEQKTGGNGGRRKAGDEDADDEDDEEDAEEEDEEDEEDEEAAPEGLRRTV